MKFLRGFSVAAVAVFGVACTQQVVPEPENAAINVVAGVVQMRAGYAGTEVLPEKFFMDVDQPDDLYDYQLTEMIRDVVGQAYHTSDGSILKWAGNDRNPAVKALTLPSGLTAVDAQNSMKVAVKADQSTESAVEDSDLLGADTAELGGVDVVGDDIMFSFRHLMSKLVVKYTLGESLKESEVTDVALVLSNVCLSGGFTYKTMSFDEAVVKEYGDVKMYNDASAMTAEAIFFPYVPEENPILMLKARIDGMNRVFTCPVVSKQGAFESGRRYVLKVQLDGSSVTATDVSISSGWEDAGMSDNDLFTE